MKFTTAACVLVLAALVSLPRVASAQTVGANAGLPVTGLPAVIPIFPLESPTLFPNGTFPLHIFEPRYRAMIADALKGDRIIGMALLKPGHETEYEGRPPIFAMGCAGLITHVERQNDGRFNLILRGEGRGSRRGNGRDGDRDDDLEVVKALLSGRVVPVLGLDRGTDLAAQLALAFGYPADRALGLARVSQYVATMNGSGPLYDELHRRFEEAAEPQPIHRFLAGLPPLLRERGAPHQLVISTRYDLALERAFETAGEEFDVVTYVATGPYRGKFWHRAPGAEPRPIDVPNTYAAELSLERRTVLLRLHGAVDPFPDREWESFVITEDDYIDYLGRSDLVSSVPVALAAHLRRTHFLFIGYEMVDWNLHLVMHRVWGDRPLAYRSWALDPEPSALEQAFWRRFDVDVLEVEPDEYVGLLERRLEGA